MELFLQGLNSNILLERLKCNYSPRCPGFLSPPERSERVIPVAGTVLQLQVYRGERHLLSLSGTGTNLQGYNACWLGCDGKFYLTACRSEYPRRLTLVRLTLPKLMAACAGSAVGCSKAHPKGPCETNPEPNHGPSRGYSSSRHYSRHVPIR